MPAWKDGVYYIPTILESEGKEMAGGRFFKGGAYLISWRLFGGDAYQSMSVYSMKYVS